MKYVTWLMPMLMMVSSWTARAQETVSTSPDQAESAAPVPCGVFQTEARFRYIKSGEDGARELLATVDFRYGLTPMAELHVATDFANVKIQDSASNGLKPLTIGIKTRICQEQSVLPESSIEARVQLPDVASSDFKSPELAPEIGLLFRNHISNSTELDYNLFAQWDGETAAPEYRYALSPEFQFGRDKWKVFAEVFGLLRQNDSPEHWLDSGIVFLMTDKMQLELAAGYELTSREGFHDIFGLAGFSFRL